MLTKLFTRALLTIFITTVITGCALVQTNDHASLSTTAPESNLENAEIKVEADETPEIRPFDSETLYQLLVAELAGIRQQPHIALQKYTAQAVQTRDPQIAARAASIAAYLDALPELLVTSQLWVELEPDNPRAHQLYALALIEEKKLVAAFPHAKISAWEGEDEILLTLVARAESTNDSIRRELLKHYTDLLNSGSINKKSGSKHQEFTTVALGKAMLLLQLQEKQQALEQITDIHQQYPENEIAALMKAQLLHQLNTPEEAINSLRKSLQLLPKSRKLRLQYARMLAEEDLPEAHRQLTTLAEQFPRDSQLHFTLAAVSQQLGLTEQAINILTRLSKHPASSADAHLELGKIADQDNNLSQALFHYRQVHSGSRFIAAANRTGQILVELGEPDTAQLYLQKLRVRRPDQAIILYQIESELLVDQKRSDEAHELLSKAISEYPQDPSLLYSRAMINDRNQDFINSEADLRAILEIDPNHATALNALGYNLTLRTTRFQEAHELILRALEISPDNPAIIDSLGWVLFRMGKYEESLRELQRAFAQFPDPEVAAHLGEVLWVVNQREEANKTWQLILDKDPNNEIVLETINRLRDTH